MIWNWKSALYSSVLRGLIFFFANLTAGLHAAEGAMLAEFVFRAVTAGFYGAATQRFRQIEPAWRGALLSLSVLIPVSHSLELAIHWWRGTPHLRTSIGASVIFTIVSTLFNLYAMRRGVFVTGTGDSRSLIDDFRRLPRLLWST